MIAAATAPSAAASAGRQYASAEWGFRIDQPPGWSASRDFSSNYLANGAWKVYAGPDLHGTPVVALTMPGSNPITDAEIRIGAGTGPDAVSGCLQPPTAVRPGSIEHRTIGGVDFLSFKAGDAAMSHRLVVHGYRTVHQGTCYAIDLMVFGTNPEVYDPPATPPFSDTEAFARMQEILGSFRFTRNGTPDQFRSY